MIDAPSRAVAAALLLLLCLPAQAHLLNRTQLNAELAPDDARLVLTLAADLSAAFDDAEHYHAISHGQREEPETVRRVVTLAATALVVELTTANGSTVDAPLRLTAFAWPEGPLDSFTASWAAPMARFRFESELPPQARSVRFKLAGEFPFPRPVVLTGLSPAGRFSVFSETERWSPRLRLNGEGAAPPPSRWALGMGYFEQGARHIVPEGTDHLLFLAALLLGARSLRQLVFLITAFTLAHSLTLALVVTGLITPPTAWVEVLIAASVAAAAALNLVTQRSAAHPWLCVPFGLLHGMGFASALGALGLPAGEFVLGLITFNAGIEAAQLALVAAFALTVWRWRTAPAYRARVVQPGSTLILLIACLWLVTRIREAVT